MSILELAEAGGGRRGVRHSARELPNVAEELATLENRLRDSAVPRDVGPPFYLIISGIGLRLQLHHQKEIKHVDNQIELIYLRETPGLRLS